MYIIVKIKHNKDKNKIFKVTRERNLIMLFLNSKIKLKEWSQVRSLYAEKVLKKQ